MVPPLWLVPINVIFSPPRAMRVEGGELKRDLIPKSIADFRFAHFPKQNI
jgi:hypothetical protein